VVKQTQVISIDYILIISYTLLKKKTTDKNRLYREFFAFLQPSKKTIRKQDRCPQIVI